MPQSLVPLPQHHALTDWLRQEECEVWQWFKDREPESRDADQVRLSLLRDTYRMDADGHPELFQEIAAAVAALGLDAVVHAYQAQGEALPNAAVCYLPGEAHLIFSGPILSLLSPLELRAVIGHELAHQLLWQMADGVYLLADRILDAAAAHPAAKPAHLQSARVWRLATELFADRGAYLATGSLEAAVAGLVKTTTGLAQVSAAGYLAQSAEVFSKSRPKTDQLSHPETFIRARALQLWTTAADSPDDEIAAMLDFEEDLTGLTLVQQAQLSAQTRQFIGQFVQPGWMQSDPVLAHARAFFRDFLPPAAGDPAVLTSLAALPLPQREYLCQVMLDFCAVDPDLHEQPVVRALEFARALECLGVFEKLLTKELKLKARDLKQLKSKAAAMPAAELPRP